MTPKRKQIWDMKQLSRPPKALPKDTTPTSFTLTAAQLREREILGWSEVTFQNNVIRLAKSLGYGLIYHTHDSRRSQPGFPDLVMVNVRSRRMLIRELKATKGRVSPAQKEWAEGFLAVGADFGFWRPEDWVSGRIQRELQEGGHADA